jgi:G3E family GTPase
MSRLKEDKRKQVFDPGFNQMRIWLIAGFLGSGKTTFIKKIVEKIPQNKKATIILNNEANDFNFDAKDLQKQALKSNFIVDVHNIPFNQDSSSKETFENSLVSLIMKTTTNFLFIEINGLSDPLNALKTLNSPEILKRACPPSIICIVDTKNFIEQNQNFSQIRHQVMIAHKLILNKSDIVSDNEKVRKILFALNPKAQQYETRFGELPDIFSKKESILPQNLNLFRYLSNTESNDMHYIRFKTSKKLKSNNISAFVEGISKIAYRTKGFLALDNNHTCSMQTLQSMFQIEPTEEKSVTEIMAIAPGISCRDIENIYHKHI